MELELRIIRDPYSALPKQRVRVFSESGGDVGRAADSYWLLPDPKCYLSGHHCTILFRDGAFWVRDTSRNGVFMNGSEEPLGFGRKAKLAHGDEIKFATYKVLVRIKAREKPHPGSVEVGLEPGPPIEAEELFAEVFTETPVDAAQDSPQREAAVEHEMEKVETPSQTTNAAVAQDAQSSPDSDVEEKPRPMEAALREMEPAIAVESTGEHEQQHEMSDESSHEPMADEAVESVADEPAEAANQPEPEPVPQEQPAELLATQAIDPALIAAETRRVIHIDRDRLQAAGHLPSGKMERLVSNQFRHIKRPVIKNALGRGAEPVPNGHLVMVTSSLPGEGKTFSSLNLALSIAREKDLEVVLIDADVAKATVSRIFGLQAAPGLLNALADDLLDVESLILPTDVKGLSLLPAGHCAEEDIATELLASTRMDEVAARIGARSAHRIALFDSPPLLLTNEARVLASLMGQILLVVRAGVTPQQAVLEAIGYVDEQKPLGLVLNQSKGHAPGSYYGYGAYGYGVYGSDESAADASIDARGDAKK
jgi:exopolysaccharide/PEP-CTERM locus tyrosine autokinase